MARELAQRERNRRILTNVSAKFSTNGQNDDIVYNTKHMFLYNEKLQKITRQLG